MNRMDATCILSDRDLSNSELDAHVVTCYIGGEVQAASGDTAAGLQRTSFGAGVGTTGDINRVRGGPSTQGLGYQTNVRETSSNSAIVGRAMPEHVVSFPLLSRFQNEANLVQLYPDENHQAVATAIRDLQLITFCHTEGIMTGTPLRTEPRLALDYPMIGPPAKLSQSISVLIDTLTRLKDCIVSTYEDVNNKGHSSVSHRVVDYIPLVSLSSDWPLNKNDVYLSRLVCRFRASTQNLDPNLVEVTDYCLAHHDTLCVREPLFQSDGRVVVLRSQMLSMDHYVPVNAAVVNAWVRVCVDRWLKHDWSRTCLDVVHQQTVNDSQHHLVDHWRSCIANFQIPITSAELVFIPLIHNNQYLLLVINFRKKKIQCIDPVHRLDRLGADEFVEKTVAKFWDLLKTMRDKRHDARTSFGFELVFLPWVSSTSDHDSGLSVMHLINLYDYPNSGLLNIRMQEDQVRTSLRVSICANMVISRVNTLRDKVLADVQQYIVNKNNKTITASEEVELFRANFNMLDNV